MADLLLFTFLLIRAAVAASCADGNTIQFRVGNCTIRSPNEPEVQSWGAEVALNNERTICMVPSTVLNDTFLTTTSLCQSSEQLKVHQVDMTPAQCASRRGGPVSADKFKGVPLSNLVQNPGWTLLNNTIEDAVEVSMQLSRQAITTTVGLITKGQNSAASHLGLATDSSILKVLKGQGLIVARSFGLNVGSQSVQSPRGGSLVLGGYDQGSVANPFLHEFPIPQNDRLQDRHCPLQVELTGLTLEIKMANASETESRDIFSKSTGITVCVEPYDNLFRLPSETLSALLGYVNQTTEQRTHLVPVTEYADELVNLEPGLVYRRSSGEFNAALRFTINDKMTVEVPFHELQRPLRGLDSNGAAVLNTSYNELQIFGDPAPGNAPVLGKAFLSQVYLFVDYDAGKFYMAPLNSEAGAVLPVATGTCPSGGLTATEKGLIALGAVLGALVLAILAWAIYRWRRRRNPRINGTEAQAMDHAPGNATSGAQNRSVVGTGQFPSRNRSQEMQDTLSQNSAAGADSGFAIGHAPFGHLSRQSVETGRSYESPPQRPTHTGIV
ncbi:hypothetical protein QC762_500605 [Podospora pseudocomata]|uniref:Peptidase A1 domain-containing protein n=1 Tax=Podospora pseudocomata TaxID=2093779 RepID=A0ABR0GAF1_9PEZI|nr:hypothetical protein QC762_500605 [Podospora pseudocomata]